MSMVAALLVVGIGAGGLFIHRHLAAAPKMVLKPAKAEHASSPPSSSPSPDQSRFRTAKVKRGDLFATITAAGTLEPQAIEDVSARVAGRLSSFGQDVKGKRIDYASPVDVGTVLAKIDDTTYIADRNTAAAALNSAQKGVDKTNADLSLAKASFDKASRDWDRTQKAGPPAASSQADYDNFHSAFETAKASVDVAAAEVEQAKALVIQAQAALNKAQQNVDSCIITSPAKGIIIDVRVNIGEAVIPAESHAASTDLAGLGLFLIAKDLTKMQVFVQVNQFDIQHIQPGQRVDFTTEAAPGTEFHGTVNKVRLNATLTQNVVSYTVEVDADNPDGQLLPYLSTNVRFEYRLQNVMLAPNAALRYKPATDEIAPDARATLDEPDNKGGRDAPPRVSLQAQIIYGHMNTVPDQLYGTTPDYLWPEMAEGEPFSVRDVMGANKVCLLGRTVVRELFGNESPLGQEVRLHDTEFKVIGVLTTRGTDTSLRDRDDIVLAPWTTLKYRVSDTPNRTTQPSAAAMSTFALSTTQSTEKPDETMALGRVWVRDADPRYVRPIRVRIGASAGDESEIRGDELSGGMELVIGDFGAETAPSTGGKLP
jgi:HlyD family secretion protein